MYGLDVGDKLSEECRVWGLRPSGWWHTIEKTTNEKARSVLSFCFVFLDFIWV